MTHPILTIIIIVFLETTSCQVMGQVKKQRPGWCSIACFRPQEYPVYSPPSYHSPPNTRVGRFGGNGNGNGNGNGSQGSSPPSIPGSIVYYTRGPDLEEFKRKYPQHVSAISMPYGDPGASSSSGPKVSSPRRPRLSLSGSFGSFSPRRSPGPEYDRQLWDCWNDCILYHGYFRKHTFLNQSGQTMKRIADPKLVPASAALSRNLSFGTLKITAPFQGSGEFLPKAGRGGGGGGGTTSRSDSSKESSPRFPTPRADPQNKSNWKCYCKLSEDLLEVLKDYKKDVRSFVKNNILLEEELKQFLEKHKYEIIPYYQLGQTAEESLLGNNVQTI